MSHPVKHFHSGQAGAPTLTGQAGTLVALLDACLLNGFDLKAVDALSVAGGVATATLNGGHSYELGAIVLIEGATPAGLNGEQKLTGVTANTFTFATTEADATATGTISAKRAPVGQWEKAFSGTDIACYRSTDPLASGFYLRVDDAFTGAGTTRFGQWRGFETMSDADTGTGPFPTLAQLGDADGLLAIKSYTADAAVRAWALVADSRTLYFFARPREEYPGGFGAHAFGDFLSYRPSDPYACLAIGADQSGNYSYTQPPARGNGFSLVNATASEGHYLARSWTQVLGAVAFSKLGDSGINAYLGSGGMAYPNPVDNGLYCAPVRVLEADNVRGRLRGLYQPLHPTPLNHLDRISGIEGLPGRELLALDLNYGSSGASNWTYDGQCLIDITGPWD